MELFALFFTLFFATQACSRSHGLSGSHNHLHARLPPVSEPEGEGKGPEWPPPEISRDGIYIWDGYNNVLIGYTEESAQNLAAKRPSWETQRKDDLESLYPPSKDPPKLGESDLILSQPKEGKQVWLLYLEPEILGHLIFDGKFVRPDSFSGKVAHFSQFTKSFVGGNDERTPEREKAAQDLEEFERLHGGDLENALALLRSKVPPLFDTSRYDAAQADVILRQPWNLKLGSIFDEASSAEKGLRVVFIDNSDPSDRALAPVSLSLPSNMFSYIPSFKRPTLTLSGWNWKQKRSNILNTLTTSVEPQNSNSTMNLESEYEAYLGAFTASSSNVSAIIGPIVQEMLRRSNSSLVWNAAWSLFADLTGSSPVIQGPFSFGFNCMESLENTAFALLSNSSSANQTTTKNGTTLLDIQKTYIMAVTFEAMEIYNEGWMNATAALNNTNLLETMSSLAANMSPTNFSIIPSQYRTNSSTSYDSSYFLQYANSS